MAETGNTIVLYDGRKVTARVRDCILATQALFRKRANKPRFTINLSQGSFSHTIDASGSTHDGDAVTDVRTESDGLDRAEIRLLSQCFKQCGAQPFTRDERDGMEPHLHVLFATDAQMSEGAKWQIVEYDAGRNGLTNRGKDRNPYRVNPKLRWSYTQGKPVLRP